jgi:hypothetical protein
MQGRVRMTLRLVASAAMKVRVAVGAVAGVPVQHADALGVGFGSIVALYCLSSTLYQIH